MFMFELGLHSSIAIIIYCLVILIATKLLPLKNLIRLAQISFDPYIFVCSQ